VTAAGEIVAAYGRQFLVETADGALARCVSRGKRNDYACGDRVTIAPTAPDEAVIEALTTRTTLFHRASPHRVKLMAANVTQVALVTAVDPSFSDELLCRAIVRAEHAGLAVLLLLNKVDLPGHDAARERLAPFARAGYPVLDVSAKGDVSALRARLVGQRTVLVGQSGMGKSTLVNALFPGADAATREISTFLASGRHTTTHGRLYRLPEGGAVIDCPGLQEFGLADLRRADIEHGFVEIRGALGHCRFADCRHRSEPGCAVKTCAAEGRIDPRRFALLERIVDAEHAT
jgi:ribosome biogenesis GTPase